MAGLLLTAPALAIVALFFVLPLGMSFVLAFRGKAGGFTLEHFDKVFDLYTTDLLFTLAITLLSTVLIGFFAIAIAGYLTLGENPRAVAILRWLYRWPLFIPFIVTAQVMRTFLAKNGMLNHALIGGGFIEPLAAQSLLDWRGIVIAFVWKQVPFVTLLVAGAMASLESQHIEAARNLGARAAARAVDIVLPQVRGHAAGRTRAVVRDHAVGAVGADDDQPEFADDDDGRRRRTGSTPTGDYAVANALVPVVASWWRPWARRSTCGTLWPGRSSDECSMTDSAAAVDAMLVSRSWCWR
jgi:ABC-type spermidine/putrescine transport system permease subunit II